MHGVAIDILVIGCHVLQLRDIELSFSVELTSLHDFDLPKSLKLSLVLLRLTVFGQHVEDALLEELKLLHFFVFFIQLDSWLGKLLRKARCFSDG